MLQLPLHADGNAGLELKQGVKLAQAVDLGNGSQRGKRIVVVGGGMTGASLALGAASQGASAVLLVKRSKLKVQDFSCSPGWSGSKLLTHFGETEGWPVSTSDSPQR